MTILTTTMSDYRYFPHIYRGYRRDLLQAPRVDVGSWHSKSTEGNPLLVTRELPYVSFNMYVDRSILGLQHEVKPNLPWAEEHMLERLGGVPLNPPPSHVNWPWSHGQHQAEIDKKFSHTYPERMWPKYAEAGFMGPKETDINMGIRFEYGDLDDLVNLLISDRYTRQAYLPIFFPEDTGGSNRIKERIPCSLGYHFMVRNNSANQPVMDCMYTMRSCDFVRHFRDDIYMAARLLQWIAMRINEETLGEADILPRILRVHIASLHIMEGDKYKLTQEEKNDGKR